MKILKSTQMRKTKSQKIIVDKEIKEECVKEEKMVKILKEAMTIAGFDLKHPDFIETPARVARWWLKAAEKPELPPIKMFPIKSESELILIRDISVKTLCPHHLTPVFGVAHVAYIPGRQAIGLSKIVRLVRWAAANPITQENLGVDIADIIEKLIFPKGVMVILDLRHSCMVGRGVKEDGSTTTTSVLRGFFRNPPRGKNPREEMLKLIGISKSH